MPDGSNTFEIKTAIRENTAAFIALAGPSGSGKTRSALELATGLANGGKILVADTEGKRSLHYADMYEFDRVGWQPPFTPERNAELIDLAETRGYAVLVIDSQSDEYEGEGGLQEIRDATKDEFWARTKARHKAKLINRMRRAKVHIIFCLRAEERVRISKIDGRTVVEPLGWQPICEKRFLYEVQSSFLFDPRRPGVPLPIKLYDIHAQFFPADKPVTRDAGRALAQWCAGGIAAEPEGPTLAERVRQEAEKGADALQACWTSILTAAQRRELGADFLAQMKVIAAAVKRADDPSDDIPFGDDDNDRRDNFGLPPLDEARAAQQQNSPPASEKGDHGELRHRSGDTTDAETQPAGDTRTPPPPRDEAFWDGESYALDVPVADPRAFQAEMHRRLREARHDGEVIALRDHNGASIDGLPKAYREDILGALMDREKALRAVAQ